MKAFYRKTIASCISLIILFLTIGPAAADNTTSTTASVASVVEVRGPVYNGSTLTDILTNTAYGDGTTLTMDANKFAVFFYDIDNNVTTETLSIKDVTEELRYYPDVEKTAGNVTT